MKSVGVKSNTYIDSILIKKLMIKIQNLKSGILLQYQNIKIYIKIFLQKVTLQIGLAKFL